ncbi:unnamed protein product [Sphagnum tenellum]
MKAAFSVRSPDIQSRIECRHYGNQFQAMHGRQVRYGNSFSKLSGTRIRVPHKSTLMQFRCRFYNAASVAAAVVNVVCSVLRSFRW